MIENVNPTDVNAFPVVVIGNKSDLPRAVTDEEAREWCKKNGSYPYYECQAINGVFVESAFFKIGELSSRIGDTLEFGMPMSLLQGTEAMHLSVADDARRT